MIHGDRPRDGGSRAAALASGERQALAHGEREPDAAGPGSPQHLARGEGRGVPARLGRQVRVSGVAHRDLVTGNALRRDLVARARHGEAEDVETRPDVADGAGRERRDPRCRRAHERPSWRMSLRTPAAVTAGPAPGPVITSGLAL